MTNMENRTDEHEMAIAVIKIAESMPSGCANLNQIRSRIERFITLTSEDWEPSDSLPTQPRWHQILRNINSNRNSQGNFIYEGYLEHLDGGGYCITDKGRRYLRRGSSGLQIG